MSFPSPSAPLNSISHLQLHSHSFMIRPSNILSPSFQQSSSIDPVCLPQYPVNSRSHSHSIPHIPPSKDPLLPPFCTLHKVYPSSSHCNCLPQSNSPLLSSPSHCSPTVRSVLCPSAQYIEITSHDIYIHPIL